MNAFVNIISMDRIREKVGGPKNRYKLDGYNLDLTYITPRLIAMAFPASGLQKIYRNSIDQVRDFLQKNHGKTNYQIMNLSGREVDEQKLANVHTYNWEDHQAPPFGMLFQICNTMCQFLEKDEKRVSAVHCNHGKGRTGTIICCFMLYCSMFKQNAQIAMDYYARKRFQIDEGFGVTQPCQIQYIQYFARMLADSNIIPRVLSLAKVIFKGKHEVNPLYIKLRSPDYKKPIMTTKKSKTNTLVNKGEKDQITLKIIETVNFAGDIKLQIKTPTAFDAREVATYSFNTAFIEDQVAVPLFDLSPYALRKSGEFSEDFTMKLTFKPICQCPRTVDFHLRCAKCREYLISESDKWKEIKKVLRKRDQLTQGDKERLLGLHMKNKDLQQQILHIRLDILQDAEQKREKQERE